MTSVLNIIIDQKLFPENYVNGESIYRISEKLIKAFKELHDVSTKDPYLKLAIELGYITPETFETLNKDGKFKWSMSKILEHSEINPSQILLSGDVTFRDNALSQSGLSEYLYHALSKSYNRTTEIFTFKSVYTDILRHNNIVNVAEKVAKRFIKDYDMKNKAKLKTVTINTYDKATDKEKIMKAIKKLKRGKGIVM